MSHVVRKWRPFSSATNPVVIAVLAVQELYLVPLEQAHQDGQEETLFAENRGLQVEISRILSKDNKESSNLSETACYFVEELSGGSS